MEGERQGGGRGGEREREREFGGRKERKGELEKKSKEGERKW